MPTDHELLWVIPFLALLATIATLPLLQKHWWEKNYPAVAFGLGALVAFRYVFILRDIQPLLHTAQEYFSFIALIGSLFVVAGGIHIRVKGEATPAANCVFLLVGSVLANFLGTTGASMVLIRPWIRMNKYRLTAFHVVFFIFLVSNIGGGLTPIGDPPLFLGFLRGVPFFWVLENVWPIWLLTVSALLVIFYLMDNANFRKAPLEIRLKETQKEEEWSFSGGHNLFFLLAILASVFIEHPRFLREAIMITASVLSFKTTSESVHKSNDFSFAPIREVAILFLGIFATMIPALHWLEHHAPEIGIRTAGQFFWASGTLSSALDNAPTYLNFLSASLGLHASALAVNAGIPSAAAEKARVALLLESFPQDVRAISVASVFFGAMTYIGNGPNFLVKSIAEQFKVKTPSFFGYALRYSLPILLPLFALVWFLFFRY